MTGLSVVKAALRLLGAIGEGQTPSSSESSDALEALNAMLGVWNTNRQNLFSSSYASYALVTTQQLYTLGTGGGFNAARPVKIISIDAVIGDAGNSTPTVEKARIPIEIITVEQWGAIRSRMAKSTIPERVYPDMAFPLIALNFWPVPTFTGTAPQVEIYQWARLVAFADLTTPYTFPEGYELALKSNLAVTIAPEWDRIPSPALLQTAAQSLSALRELNASIVGGG